MKPYSARQAVDGAKLVTEDGKTVTNVIFSANYIAGIVNQNDCFLGSMGLWDKITGIGLKVNGLLFPDLKMYEESPKEYWICKFGGPVGIHPMVGGLFLTREDACQYENSFLGHDVIKVVEVK